MITGAQVDTFVPNANGVLVPGGSVAQRLMNNGFKVSSLRTCEVLRKEEWKQIDEVVVGVARKRLVGIGELISRGLVYNVENALGTTQVEWETSSDMTEAEVNMSGVTEGERDRIVFTQVNMPLPVVHKDFRINIRALEASRRLGQPLDTTQATLAARIVSEKVESLLYTGSTVKVLGGTVEGLENATNRNTGSVTAAWATATGEQIVGDILAMIAAANGDNMYGPFGIFVPLAAYNRMLNDYKAASDKTTLTRALEIPELAFIRSSSDVTAGSVLMVQLTSDVIDVVNGMQPTVVQWESHGGMVVNFKVMAIIVPRIRSTQTSQSGVVHYS